MNLELTLVILATRWQCLGNLALDEKAIIRGFEANKVGIFLKRQHAWRCGSFDARRNGHSVALRPARLVVNSLEPRARFTPHPLRCRRSRQRHGRRAVSIPSYRRSAMR